MIVTYQAFDSLVLILESQFEHELVPVLSGRELHEHDHGRPESLEIVFLIEGVLEHHPTEEIDTQASEYEKQQEDQSEHVCDLWHDVQHCVENEPHVHR